MNLYTVIGGCKHHGLSYIMVLRHFSDAFGSKERKRRGNLLNVIKLIEWNFFVTLFIDILFILLL